MKTETHLRKTSKSFMNILESIKTHLFLLKQKDIHKHEEHLYQESMRPYVAAEGDILNLYKKPLNVPQSEDMPINYEAEGLDQQLLRLDEMLQENNQFLEENLNDEFNKYEEKNKFLESIKRKAKMGGNESVARLRSAKM